MILEKTGNLYLVAWILQNFSKGKSDFPPHLRNWVLIRLKMKDWWKQQRLQKSLKVSRHRAKRDSGIEQQGRTPAAFLHKLSGPLQKPGRIYG